jgi:hypothetical protein
MLTEAMVNTSGRGYVNGSTVRSTEVSPLRPLRRFAAGTITYLISVAFGVRPGVPWSIPGCNIIKIGDCRVEEVW